MYQNSINYHEFSIIKDGYSTNFPGAFILFNIIYQLVYNDLFQFSVTFFSLFIFLFSIILPYLIIENLFGSNAAFLGGVLIIPSQIIEVTITPNSVGIVLLLAFLLLILKKGKNYWILQFLIIITIIITHSITGIVLFSILVVGYFYTQFYKIKDILLNYRILVLFIITWLVWMLMIVPFGTGFLPKIRDIIFKEPSISKYAIEYTVGFGNLIYPWIQQLNFLKYILYAIIILITLFIYFRNYKKIEKQRVLIGILFLLLSISLVILTLVTLNSGFPDTHNLISRTLNYSMIFCCFFTSSVFLIEKQSIFQRKTVILILFIFLLLIYGTYPLYSYARDSYINFPQSYHEQFNFDREFLDSDQSQVEVLTKNEYYYSFMNNKKDEIDLFQKKIDINSNIYSNGWIWYCKSR